jgi:hypothetical protein
MKTDYTLVILFVVTVILVISAIIMMPLSNEQIVPAEKIAERMGNLLDPNQANGGENGTTIGFGEYNNGAKISSDDTESYQGNHSIKVVTDGISKSDQGFAVDLITGLTPHSTYSASVYLRGNGTVYTQLSEYNTDGSYVTGTYSGIVILKDNWDKVLISKNLSTGTKVLFNTATAGKQATVFYADALDFRKNNT